MSEKRWFIAVLAVFTILLASAAAQDEKNELTGMFGKTVISDQGIQGATYFNPFVRSGKGWSFGVNYARHLRTTAIWGVSLEVPAVYNPDEDLNAGLGIVPIDYSEIFVTPAARVNLFPTTAVSPWVSFGGGFGRFSQNKNLIFDAGANPGKNTTTGVIQGGVGLDVKFWHRFSIRGEGRDFWSGHPDFPLANTGKTRQHNYFVGVGVVWHF
ncbi:MAG: outer membrane beta-barrel protein [Acidobacteriia bacterium]|nr:outer membrane beta-barrel protein [Terriglobia bacterium]